MYRLEILRKEHAARQSLPKRVESFDLTVARLTGAVPIEFSANCVSFLYFSGAALVEMRLDEAGPWVPVRGPGNFTQSYDQVNFRWAAQAGVTVELILGWDLR